MVHRVAAVETPPPQNMKIIKLVCALFSLPACYNFYTKLDTIHVLLQGVSHPWHASITRRMSLSVCVVHIYAVAIQMAIIKRI